MEWTSFPHFQVIICLHLLHADIRVRIRFEPLLSVDERYLEVRQRLCVTKLLCIGRSMCHVCPNSSTRVLSIEHSPDN
jgi:hypothetical protein